MSEWSECKECRANCAGLDYETRLPIEGHRCFLDVKPNSQVICQGCGAQPVDGAGYTITTMGRPFSRVSHQEQTLAVLCRRCAVRMAVAILEQEVG